MPTPKKTLAELKLSGTYKRNPARYQALTEPKPSFAPVGRAPRHLEKAERRVWSEIVISHGQSFQRRDRILLEIICRLMVRMRSPNAKISDFNGLASLLGKFGLLSALKPVDTTNQEPAEDQWDDL